MIKILITILILGLFVLGGCYEGFSGESRVKYCDDFCMDKNMSNIVSGLIPQDCHCITSEGLLQIYKVDYT